MKIIFRAISVTVTALLALILLAPIGSAADPEIPVNVEIPQTTENGSVIEVTNAQMRWSLNHESGSGTYFGGCNFLIAGKPGTDGNAGKGKVWADADNLYHASSGNVSVIQPDNSGGYRPSTFATKCQAPDGTTTTSLNNLSSQAQVQIDGGTGVIDRDKGTMLIRWKGTFSVVYYGGLTYWWVTDPILTVKADGTAKMTGTAGGYGTSQADASKWQKLSDTNITLANLSGVKVQNSVGFVTNPHYVGQTVKTVQGNLPQIPQTIENKSTWGSFPQNFVDFQNLTGQSAYWYSSGGQRDWAKVPSPLYISFDAKSPITVKPGGTDLGSTTPIVAAKPPILLKTPIPASIVKKATTPLTADTSVAPAAHFMATPASTQGIDKTELIPSWNQIVGDSNNYLLLLLAAVMIGISATIVGFRKKWLILPFTHKNVRLSSDLDK